MPGSENQMIQMTFGKVTVRATDCQNSFYINGLQKLMDSACNEQKQAFQSKYGE
jgi:hypothetical protein